MIVEALEIGVGFAALVGVGKRCDVIARRVDPSLVLRPGPPRTELPKSLSGWLAYVGTALAVPIALFAMLRGPIWLSSTIGVVVAASIAQLMYTKRIRPLATAGATSTEVARLIALTALVVVAWSAAGYSFMVASHASHSI